MMFIPIILKSLSSAAIIRGAVFNQVNTVFIAIWLATIQVVHDRACIFIAFGSSYMDSYIGFAIVFRVRYSFNLVTFPNRFQNAYF